jgi:hypothetical protein
MTAPFIVIILLGAFAVVFSLGVAVVIIALLLSKSRARPGRSNPTSGSGDATPWWFLFGNEPGSNSGVPQEGHPSPETNPPHHHHHPHDPGLSHPHHHHDAGPAHGGFDAGSHHGGGFTGGGFDGGGSHGGGHH